MTARLRIGACLSLSGRFAQFGQQAARGLDAWRSLDGATDVLVEDDRSDRRELEELLPGVAAHCDLLLGPYSTQLMRTAGKMAAQFGWLAWNHGGSGADVEGAHPGHVVSVLTPASRYAEPFLRHVVGEGGSRELVIVHGAGSFGRQVADRAEKIGRQLGIRTSRADADDPLPPPLACQGSGISSARASSSRTPISSARPSGRHGHHGKSAPLRQAYASSAASSLTQRACSG